MCPKVTYQYKKNLKNKIIKSAISTFSKYGYDKSRMDDIAKTAKLSKGTIYLYFKNKEELFNAISERNTNELKNQLSKLFQNSDNDLITSIQNFYEDINDQGYIGKDIEITGIAYGLVSLYDGLKINKFLGIDEDQNKKTWSRIVKTILQE